MPIISAQALSLIHIYKPKTLKKKVAKPEKHHPGYGEGGKFHDRNHENPLPDSETLTFALVGNQNCGKRIFVISIMEFSSLTVSDVYKRQV